MQKPIDILALKKKQPYAVKGANMTKANETDMNKRVVSGFFNSCYFFDAAYDVILPGAFEKSLKEHGVNAPRTNYRIKHLFQHDWDKILAVPQVLEERTEDVDGVKVTGLYFETKMPQTTLGNETLIQYQEGNYDQHSIGYQYVDGELVQKGDDNWDKYAAMLINRDEAEKAGFMFVWKELKLMEGSTVAFGCNELTPYLGVKSDNKQGQAIKLNERIDNIQKLLISGKQMTEDAVHALKMQTQQIKQILNELFNEEPDMKSTLLQGRKQDSTQGQRKSRFALRSLSQ